MKIPTQVDAETEVPGADLFAIFILSGPIAFYRAWIALVINGWYFPQAFSIKEIIGFWFLYGLLEGRGGIRKYKSLPTTIANSFITPAIMFLCAWVSHFFF